MKDLHRVLLWEDAVRIFERDFLPGIRLTEQRNNDGQPWVDSCMRREAWNNWPDSLCEDGRISDWQYENWSQPESCEKETKELKNVGRYSDLQRRVYCVSKLLLSLGKVSGFKKGKKMKVGDRVQEFFIGPGNAGTITCVSDDQGYNYVTVLWDGNIKDLFAAKANLRDLKKRK